MDAVRVSLICADSRTYFSHARGSPHSACTWGDHVRADCQEPEQEKGRERLEAKWEARPEGEEAKEEPGLHPWGGISLE